MCVTKAECLRYVGQWVRFRTPYGWHRGVIERVTDSHLIVLSPRREVPLQFASAATPVTAAEQRRLDVALAQWYGPPGLGWGMPGVGGWGWAWSRWAVSFLIIYALWGLLWW